MLFHNHPILDEKQYLPKLEEQTSIADFLDKKCNEIEKTIKLKEVKIEKVTLISFGEKRIASAATTYSSYKSSNMHALPAGIIFAIAISPFSAVCLFNCKCLSLVINFNFSV